MSNLVILDIRRAPKKLTGYLQRIMLEIRPGTFVWKLSGKKTRQIWEEVKSHKCIAVCVSAAKTESGFVMASHGEDLRSPCDNFGIQLVSYKLSDSKEKLADVNGVK